MKTLLTNLHRRRLRVAAIATALALVAIGLVPATSSLAEAAGVVHWNTEPKGVGGVHAQGRLWADGRGFVHMDGYVKDTKADNKEAYLVVNHRGSPVPDNKYTKVYARGKGRTTPVRLHLGKVSNVVVWECVDNTLSFEHCGPPWRIYKR